MNAFLDGLDALADKINPRLEKGLDSMGRFFGVTPKEETAQPQQRDPLDNIDKLGDYFMDNIAGRGSGVASEFGEIHKHLLDMRMSLHTLKLGNSRIYEQGDGKVTRGEASNAEKGEQFNKICASYNALSFEVNTNKHFNPDKYPAHDKFINAVAKMGAILERQKSKFLEMQQSAAKVNENAVMAR
jgi:hypothetical protein